MSLMRCWPRAQKNMRAIDDSSGISTSIAIYLLDQDLKADFFV